MKTARKTSIVSRVGRKARGFLAPLFALMISQTVLPVSVGRAQDNQTPQARDASAVQARQPEPPQVPAASAPAPGGPSEVLTLDQAVERLERKNLALAAMWLEVAQARADILTARQRPNSVLYIGGGKDRPSRTRPLEVVPKCWARALAASLAARVTEAQYQDSVRTRTADLYTAFVDVQEAKSQARYARRSLAGAEDLTKLTKDLAASGNVAKADLARVIAAQARESIAATDAEVALRKAKLTLANLLNIPDAEAERLEIKEESEDRERTLPSLAELTQLALSTAPRPPRVPARIVARSGRVAQGVGRAMAGFLRLYRAGRELDPGCRERRARPAVGRGPGRELSRLWSSTG